MLNIIVYFWHDDEFVNKYTADDVRFIKRGIDRYMDQPCRFFVITDRPELFDDDDDITAIPFDMSTHIPGTCYAKLFTFSPMAKEIFHGGRVLQLDLDAIITGNLDGLTIPDYDLILWRNPTRIPWDNPIKKGRPYYNTSIMLHKTGTLEQVWQQFDIQKTARLCRDDQWYLSSFLGENMPYWDKDDGVYRLARQDTPGSGVWGTLPANAKIVFGTGSEGKLWQPHNRAANPWVEQFVEGSPRFAA